MHTISSGGTRRQMAKYQLKAKKHLGQNFLVDDNIIGKIVTAAGLTEEETIVEIGPGMGALTRRLAASAGQVIAVELDRELIPVLTEATAGFGNVDIVRGDALETDFDQLVADKGGGFPYKVVANLPYYITTPLIMHLLSGGFSITDMMLMVQKEVARRLQAVPGTGEYGSLTVAVGYYARCAIEFFVPPTVFLPQPEVESAVVRLSVRENPAVEVVDTDFFFQVVRAAFNKRRKTLVNALMNSPLALDKEEVAKAIAEQGLDARIRGERLSIEQFAKLADAILKPANQRLG